MLESRDHFTDREGALAAYDELWSGQDRRILSIEGMSGNGKSTLLWYLATHHRQPDRPRALIDLGPSDVRGRDHLLLDRIFRSLARQLPFVDTESYWALAEELDREANVIRSRSAVLHVEVKAKDGRAVIAGPTTISSLVQHRRLAREQLLRYLVQSLDEMGDRECALLVDSYESIQHQEDGELGAWFEHELLPTLLEAWPGLRVVVAGAENLPWPPGVHERWKLKLWSQADSDRYLGRFGLHERRFLEAAFDCCGGSPLLTDMAREAWLEGQEPGGRRLTADDLEERVSLEAATHWVFHKLLARLPERLREPARVAPLLRRLSPEAINAALPDHAPMSEDDYQRVLALSIVLRRPGRPDQVHSLVRRVQDRAMRTHRAELFGKVHRRLAAHYERRSTPEDQADFAYHALAGELALAERDRLADRITRVGLHGQGVRVTRREAPAGPGRLPPEPVSSPLWKSPDPTPQSSATPTREPPPPSPEGARWPAPDTEADEAAREKAKSRQGGPEDQGQTKARPRPTAHSQTKAHAGMSS